MLTVVGFKLGTIKFRKIFYFKLKKKHKYIIPVMNIILKNRIKKKLI